MSTTSSISPIPPEMTEPHSIAQRRLLISASGICLAGLVAGAFVLSYDGLRALALKGGAHTRYAPLYPAMVDGLVVVVILSLLMARRAHWWTRVLRWSLLVLLVVGAGSLAVQRSVRGYQKLPHAWVSAGVAAGPWIILLIAAWLWLTMVSQVRAPRRVAEVDCAIVPGLAGTEPGIEPGTEPITEPDTEPGDEPAEQPAEPGRHEAPAWTRRPPPPPDVKLVGRPVALSDTDPDGIPTIDPAPEDDEPPEDTDDDRFADDRAEDPDGGDDEAIVFEHRSDTPPSSTFRSSPVPPGNEDTGENLLATGPNGEG
jgi:Protein of unknown function (DUF2637)